jgi:hypothetical protein
MAMKAAKTTQLCTLVIGSLLLLTSLVHLLGINDTVIALKTGDIARAYEANIIIIWVFGGISFLLLGIWLLFLSRELRQLSRRAWWQALVIGLALSAFGLGSWLQYPKVFHVLYFFVLGMVLLLPLAFFARPFFNKPKPS